MKIIFDLSDETLEDLKNLSHMDYEEYNEFMSNLISTYYADFKKQVNQEIDKIIKLQRIREQTEKSDGNLGRFIDLIDTKIKEGYKL